MTDLTFDFWYPSDVTRPYMPDPKGIFEAISRDLEAVGFTVNANTATWRPDYLDAEYAGKYEMWLIGWTCDWAGPDNFLKTAFFGYVDGEPSTGVLVQERRARQDDDRRPRRDRRGDGRRRSGRRRRTSSAPTSRPSRSSTPPRRRPPRPTSRASSAAGPDNEYLNLVWLDR